MIALIPKEYWSYRKWVNKERAEKLMREMDSKGIIYGGSLSYRYMCRYNSGIFYRLDVMQKYDFYWRVEPCASPPSFDLQQLPSITAISIMIHSSSCERTIKNMVG